MSRVIVIVGHQATKRNKSKINLSVNCSTTFRTLDSNPCPIWWVDIYTDFVMYQHHAKSLKTKKSTRNFSSGEILWLQEY